MKNNKIDIDDNELWKSLIQGDEKAFETLYRRYFKVLYGYGLGVVNDEEAVNDAIQDLFVDIWRMRKTLSQAKSVKYYLMSSVRRKIYKSIRPEQLKGEQLTPFHEIALPSELSPEEIFANEEDKALQSEKISHWLQQLPPRQKEALDLRFYHNLEYNEIANLLQIKEQTARNFVQKALFLLRNLAISLILLLFEFFF